MSHPADSNRHNTNFADSPINQFWQGDISKNLILWSPVESNHFLWIFSPAYAPAIRELQIVWVTGLEPATSCVQGTRAQPIALHPVFVGMTGLEPAYTPFRAETVMIQLPAYIPICFQRTFKFQYRTFSMKFKISCKKFSVIQRTFCICSPNTSFSISYVKWNFKFDIWSFLISTMMGMKTNYAWVHDRMQVHRR